MWALFLAGFGFYLGAGFKAVDKFMGPFSYVVLGGLVAFFVFNVWKRKQKMPKRKR